MAQGQSTAFSRPRTFPTGGTFMETENGTLLWNRNSALILAGCQEICTGASSVMMGNQPQQPETAAKQQPKQRTPAQQKALKRAQQMAAAQRRRAGGGQAAKSHLKAKAMAAGQGANTS